MGGTGEVREVATGEERGSSQGVSSVQQYNTARVHYMVEWAVRTIREQWEPYFTMSPTMVSLLG